MSTNTFDIRLMAQQAKLASRQVAQLNTEQKNALLKSMAEQITANEASILSANALDIQAGQEKGLSDAMLDRLKLNAQRIEDIANAILEIVALADPVGHIANMIVRPNGMQVGKMSIPLGVISMIYEARPNVTAEAAALCLKAGNVVVLRGGSEALHSNLAIANCLHQALEQHNINAAAVSVVPDPSRQVIETLLTLRDDIDLVIPRGGEGLIRYVTEHSQIPVIQHFKGVCHLFIDKYADLKKATNILVNGKTQRPSACNAIETLLVHQQIAEQFLPLAQKALAVANVKIHACPLSQSYFDDAELATEADYHAEYLAQEIAIKVVPSYQAAVDHINEFTSDHTEVIVSQDTSRTQRFIREINSSVVMVNASSRFSDGGQLGLGSEIGISTSKLHAYGPMGLQSLTTEKFVVLGDGQIRE